MSAIGEPVNPFKLVICWNALHSLVTDAKNRIFPGILWKVKLHAWDYRKRLFDRFPESITNPLGSLIIISRELYKGDDEKLT